jgi:4-amino-4-deoxy-L-arabinose transferase-like glycosyltransferase
MLVVALGAYLRVRDLDRRPMGHREAYAPGIEFPEGITYPPPRLTLWESVRGSFFEPHPPGWYATNWAWTRVTGDSLFALRLPSALAAVGALLLVFFLGARVRDPVAGLAAAAMLAFNGHDVFYSQTARPSTMACFVGLAATLILLRMAEGRGRWRANQWAYAGLSLLGLCSSYYYWPFFAAHMLWVLHGSWRGRDDLAALFRFQLAVVVAATPIVALAVFQSRDSYLTSDYAETFGQFLGFGFLFLPYGIMEGAGGLAEPPLAGWAINSLWLLGVALAITGMSTGAREERVESAPPTRADLPLSALAALAVGAAVVIVGLGWYLARSYPEKLAPVTAVAVAPLLVAGLALADRRAGLWTRRPRSLLRRAPKTLQRSVPLVLWLALVPAGLIAAVSLFIPFLAPRHMLMYLPYLLILMGAGVSFLARARPLTVAALAPIVLAVGGVHALSLRFNEGRSSSWIGYREVAADWVPRIRSDDLLFMHRHWVNTPLLYYLRHGEYDYVWGNFDERVRERPDARVWVVSYFQPGVPKPGAWWKLPTPPMEAALGAYRREATIDAFRVRIELYLPPTRGPEPPL